MEEENRAVFFLSVLSLKCEEPGKDADSEASGSVPPQKENRSRPDLKQQGSILGLLWFLPHRLVGNP